MELTHFSPLILLLLILTFHSDVACKGNCENWISDGKKWECFYLFLVWYNITQFWIEWEHISWKQVNNFQFFFITHIIFIFRRCEITQTPSPLFMMTMINDIRNQMIQDRIVDSLLTSLHDGKCRIWNWSKISDENSNFRTWPRWKIENYFPS